MQSYVIPQGYGYPIPRGQGWEEILIPLVHRATNTAQGDCLGGCNYENEIFAMRTYYNGSCTCTQGEILKDFDKKNSHHEGCFHLQFRELYEAYHSHQLYKESAKLQVYYMNDLRSLMKRNNLNIDRVKDVDMVCTCGYGEERRKIVEANPHSEDCLVILPNFHHFETGLKIRWFKYFFRDSYANQEINKGDLKKIVSRCIRSTPKPTPIPKVEVPDM